MKDPVVIIGMGEMGGVFARGFLRSGYPVYPITRDMDVTIAAENISNPKAVIVAVGEKGLDDVLKTIPNIWKPKLVLLQNELLPKDWQKHQLDNPTVISVWFEKKQPKDYKVIIPSPVYGPLADLVAQALGSINISTNVLSSPEELLVQLVVKNLYILTTNISGLQVGGNVEGLWKENQDVARAVANDVLDIQFHLIGQELSRDQLIDEMVKAFEGDWEHKCMGRSAPARLERALSIANEAGLEISKLKEIDALQKASK